MMSPRYALAALLLATLAQAEDAPAPTPAPAPEAAAAAPAEPAKPVELTRLAAPEGRALALLSITLSAPPDADDGFATLVFEGPGGVQKITVTAGERIANFGGQPEAIGKLLQISLPPGPYVLRHVTGSYEPAEGGKKREFWVPLGQRFAIAPNEVAYLGNLHVVVDGTPIAVFSDQRARDFYALAQEAQINDMSNLQDRIPQPAGLPYPY
ncbi:MAG TPA: hypothetical protein VLC08_16220 [Chitinolyticbacter sp.]|nr:hypothetical protein [Chitinolyticbacter sp.]